MLSATPDWTQGSSSFFTTAMSISSREYIQEFVSFVESEIAYIQTIHSHTYYKAVGPPVLMPATSPGGISYHAYWEGTQNKSKSFAMNSQ